MRETSSYEYLLSFIICFLSFTFVTFGQFHGAWIALQNKHGFVFKSLALLDTASCGVSLTKQSPIEVRITASVSVVKSTADWPASLITEFCGDCLSDESLFLHLLVFPITRSTSHWNTSASSISVTMSSSSSNYSKMLLLKYFNASLILFTISHKLSISLSPSCVDPKFNDFSTLPINVPTAPRSPLRIVFFENPIFRHGTKMLRIKH